MRERIILVLVVFIAFLLFIDDVFVTPGFVIPVILYAAPLLIAVCYFSPRIVAGFAICTAILILLSLVIQQVSLWMSATHLLAWALIGYLSVVLSFKMQRETALAEERERLTVKLQGVNGQLEQGIAELKQKEELLQQGEDKYKILVEQLAYLANHDPLTELPNRRTLEEAMKRVVARARRGFVSSLLFLDIDNFKAVNDTLGHAIGDQALISLSGLLRSQLRTEDLLIRLGGDEFAVVLEGTNGEQAQAVAERLCRAAMDFDLTIGGVRFGLTLSIGMATIDGQEDASKVLAKADTAMYKAKEQGGNRAVFSVPQS